MALTDADQVLSSVPPGADGDPVLLTYGETGRRSRTWWRNILHQFGAADVLVPIANLHYQYPGGPVTGTFTARYGPDNAYLDGFALTAKSPDDVPRMLEDAVRRFDRIFATALAEGKLRPDPTLSIAGAEIDPALQRLLEIGRQIDARLAELGATRLQPLGEADVDIELVATPWRQRALEGLQALAAQLAERFQIRIDPALWSAKPLPEADRTRITAWLKVRAKTDSLDVVYATAEAENPAGARASRGAR